MTGTKDLRYIQAKLSLLTLAPGQVALEKLKVATSHLTAAIKTLQLVNAVLPQWGYSDEKSLITHAIIQLKGVNMAVFRKSKKASSREYTNIVAANKDAIIKAMLGCMERNYIISFGRTRDGKSVLLSVYDGENSEKVYAATPEELADLLSELYDDESKEEDDDENSSPAKGGATNSRRR